MKATIAVIEDEPAIRRGVVDLLRLSGYEVHEAADGIHGLRVAGEPGIDLVLLDLLLPKRDGLEVLAQLRTTCPSRPVIILTARGGEDDRIRGLKSGADDYVVKPFSARELLARVEAVLRRTQVEPPGLTLVGIGSGVIDLARREVRWDAKHRLELSETETLLLQYLFENRLRAVTREDLLIHVWKIEPSGLETRTVDMHIARLRAKLKHPGGEEVPEAIVTVRSLGYMAGTGLDFDAHKPG